MIGGVMRLVSRRTLGESLAALAGGMIARADAARDAKRYRDAAVLYAEALLIAPDRAGIQIQCGHMFKEAGDLANAERHYQEAVRLTPDDADLALQMGHFYKVAGRLTEAQASYARAIELKPDWAEPISELDQLRDTLDTDLLDRMDGLAETALAEGIDRLAPELAPRAATDRPRAAGASVEIRRLGQPERSVWGMMRTLRGVQAIRGFCVSAVPIAEVEIMLGDRLVHRGPPTDSAPLPPRGTDAILRKYVFNAWHDFSDAPPGHAVMTFRFTDRDGETRIHTESVVVAAPRQEADHPASDALLTVSAGDPRPLDEQINSRPSMVRDAVRQLFTKPVRAILVQRADQLGDLVCSVPAIRRLRTVFPEARIVGLLSPANRELAATLDLFDEIVVADFPDDPVERRRLMPVRTQMALRRTLQRHAFDLAIDLSDSGVSRPLLILSGAPFLFGFRHGEFAWLSAGFEGVTRDIANGLERVPHTAKVMGLIEWLAVLAKSHARIEPRPGLSRTLLAPFGLGPDDRYVVMHTGARLAFSRWPHYRALAAMVLARTDLKVVLVTDDAGERADMPSDLTGSDRFTLVDQRPGFDAFDALVSFCSAFVGNDSGPKHLASLRGAGVVSLHMARNNWNEWGQENRGYIISRKVPCAGCSIHHEPEECGRGFACIADIRPDEVFDAMMRLIDDPAKRPQGFELGLTGAG